MLRMKLLNLNEVYRLSTNNGIINSIMSDPDRALKDALYEQLPDGGKLESYPHCSCKALKYEYRLGEVCPKCRTPVGYNTEQELESLLYIAKPLGIKRFINPKIFIDLMTLCSMKNGGFNPICYLIDDRYKPSREPKAYKVMQAWEVERNWNYFCDNLRTLVPRIFDLINSHTKRRASQKYEMDAMLEAINYGDELVYCDYIPVVNKLILAIETTGDLKRKSPTTERYGKAITDCISLPYSGTPDAEDIVMDERALTRHCNIVGRMYVGLDGFFEETIKREGKKGGLCRSDLFGLRAPFTWRTVITQICRPHKSDELVIPWAPAVGLLEPFILGELTRLHLTPNEAMGLIEEHRRVYNKLLHKVMTDIIYSFTERGLPASFIRYPSLYRQSNQMMYISEIKADVDDMSTSVPAGALDGWNGDFDGKQIK